MKRPLHISFSNREGATVSGDTRRPNPVAPGLRGDGSEIAQQMNISVIYIII